MNWNFRQPNEADLSNMNSLILKSKASWGYPSEWMALWTDKLVATPERLKERRYTLCLDEAGTLVGVGAVAANSDIEYELEDMWVHPDIQGKGVGRALFGHLKDQVARFGAVQMNIVADPNAQSFYESMGAYVIGEFESEPAGRVLPVMRLKL